MEKELQEFKHENESKTTQLNTAMEDLDAKLVIVVHMQTIEYAIYCLLV